MLGLTAGGGTGRIVQIIHSGLFHLGLNPRISISSSAIFIKIEDTSSGVNSTDSRFLTSPSLESHRPIILMAFSFVNLFANNEPQPGTPSSPHSLTLVLLSHSL